MKRSYLTALILAGGAAAWIASGVIERGEQPVAGRKPPTVLDSERSAPTVRVRTQEAEPHTARLMLRGRTEADRKVAVKAEAKGRIIELAVDKGARVATGDLIAKLAPDDRPARLAEAKALRDQRRIEYDAAKQLSEKGFRAEVQLAASRAALEAAEAALARAQEDMENTVLRAPFDGVVIERLVEIGDYIEPGDAVVRLADLDPILAVVHVSERNLGRIVRGGAAEVRLITGERLDGTVGFVAAEGEPATRTFRLEVEVANAGGALADGLTAEVTLPLDTIVAHRVSPAILTLSDAGVIGVKTVAPDNTVAFNPVKVVADGADGLWLTGLPERVTLITVGQEFVTEGQTVRPIDETTLAPVIPGDAS